MVKQTPELHVVNAQNRTAMLQGQGHHHQLSKMTKVSHLEKVQIQIVNSFYCMQYNKIQQFLN